MGGGGGESLTSHYPRHAHWGKIGKKSLTSHSPQREKKLLTKACTLGKNQHRNIDPISQALVLSQILTAIKCRRNSVSQGSCTTSLGYSSGPDRVVTVIENWRSPCSPRLWLLSPQLHPASHQCSGCHHTPGEDTVHAHFRSSSPRKTIGHSQTA